MSRDIKIYNFEINIPIHRAIGDMRDLFAEMCKIHIRIEEKWMESAADANARWGGDGKGQEDGVGFSYPILMQNSNINRFNLNSQQIEWEQRTHIYISPVCPQPTC